MSYCFREGCQHPSHLDENLKALNPVQKVPDAKEPDWLRFSDGTFNRKDRRRAQAKERAARKNGELIGR